MAQGSATGARRADAGMAVTMLEAQRSPRRRDQARWYQFSDYTPLGAADALVRHAAKPRLHAAGRNLVALRSTKPRFRACAPLSRGDRSVHVRASRLAGAMVRKNEGPKLS